MMRTTLAALFLLAAPRPATAEVTGTVVSGDLREASGLVASRRHPGILWTHNDSGDGPRLFALRTDGTLVATYTLTGALARDWEDLAIGPGPRPGVDYLFVGDIGNNCECRSDLSIYRLPEPDLPPAWGGVAIPVSAYERFPYRFPDKPLNAEALLVDPRDGAVYLVDKQRTNTAHLWRLPAPGVAGATVTLQEQARLSLPIARPCAWGTCVTGGDVAADGSAVMLTTYTHVFRWTRGPRDTLAAAMRGTPRVMLRHATPNTEALAILPDGQSYTVIPEGDHPRLSTYRMRDAGTRPLHPVLTGLIDDFDDGDLADAVATWEGTCFPGQWYVAATGAPATATLSVESNAPGGHGGVLRVGLSRTAGGGEAGVLAFVGLAWDWSTLDFTRTHGISFRLRADKPRTVRVRIEGAVDAAWYKGDAAFTKEFQATPDWRTVSLAWSDFRQSASACPGAGCVRAFRPSGVMLLGWEAVPGTGDAEFRLDDVALVYKP